jgi:hypothetical protein
MQTITRLNKTFRKHKISMRYIYGSDLRNLRIFDKHLGDKAYNIIRYMEFFNDLLKKSNTLNSDMIREIRSINYDLRNTYSNFEDRISTLEKYGGLNIAKNKKTYDSINRIRNCIADFKKNSVVNLALE